MEYKSDIQIAQECELRPIGKIAERACIDEKYLEDRKSTRLNSRSRI